MKARILAVSLGLLLFGSTTAGAQEQERTETFDSVEVAVCLNVEDRQPVNRAESFAPDVDRVFFWCKVTGAVDSTSIRHVWVYEGTEMVTVELPVKSAWWRTWSSKAILPSWTGNWEVRLLDAEGNILTSAAFTIEMPAAEPSEPEKQPSDSAGLN